MGLLSGPPLACVERGIRGAAELGSASSATVRVCRRVIGSLENEGPSVAVRYNAVPLRGTGDFTCQRGCCEAWDLAPLFFSSRLPSRRWSSSSLFAPRDGRL